VCVSFYSKIHSQKIDVGATARSCAFSVIVLYQWFCRLRDVIVWPNKLRKTVNLLRIVHCRNGGAKNAGVEKSGAMTDGEP